MNWYTSLLDQFQEKFAEYQVQSAFTEDIGSFLEEYTEGLSKSTRYLRYAQIKAFFNSIIDNADMKIVGME